MKGLSYPMKKTLAALKKKSPRYYMDFPFTVQRSTFEALQKRELVEIQQHSIIRITHKGMNWRE